MSNITLQGTLHHTHADKFDDIDGIPLVDQKLRHELGREVFALRLAVSYVAEHVLENSSQPLQMITTEQLLAGEILDGLSWDNQMVRDCTTYALPWLHDADIQRFKDRVNEYHRYGYDGLIREQLKFEIHATNTAEINIDEVDDILKKKWKYTKKPGADQSMDIFSSRVTAMGRLVGRNNTQSQKRRRCSTE